MTKNCSSIFLLIIKKCLSFIFLNAAYWSPRPLKEKCKQYISNSDPIIICMSILLRIPLMKAGVHFLGCGHACIKPPGKVFPRYMLGILGILGSFHPRIFFRSLNKYIVSTTICQGKSKRISHFDPSLFFVQFGQNESQRTHDAMIAPLWPSQRRRDVVLMVIMTVIIASCVRWDSFCLYRTLLSWGVI